MRLIGFTAAALSASLASMCHAQLTQVFSRADLDRNDSFDWAQFEDSSDIEQGTLAFGDGGSRVILTSSIATALPPFPSMTRYTQSASWEGDFAPGDAVLAATISTSAFIEMRFAPNPVRGFGAQIQEDRYGEFIGTVHVYGAADKLLGTFSVDSASTGAGDNSARFLGAVSDRFEIHRVVWSTRDAGVGFGLNRLDVIVPAPPGIGVVGASLFGMLRRRRGHCDPLQ